MTSLTGACAAIVAGLVTVLLVPGCTRREPEIPAMSACQTVPWGGYNGTPECAGLGATLVEGAHRTCVQHTDCALVGVNACEARSVGAAHASRYQQLPPPCAHPFSALCSPKRYVPVCDQGCCTVGTAP